MAPAKVRPGDRVSVWIAQVGPKACSAMPGRGACWQIRLSDLSTGGTCTTDQRYTGRRASAEWVVEDPNQLANTTCRMSLGARECPMPAFTPVGFSGLGFAPASYSGIYAETMTGAEGSAISAPSSLGNGIGGFSVSYSGG